MKKFLQILLLLSISLQALPAAYKSKYLKSDGIVDIGSINPAEIGSVSIPKELVSFEPTLVTIDPYIDMQERNVTMAQCITDPIGNTGCPVNAQVCDSNLEHDAGTSTENSVRKTTTIISETLTYPYDVNYTYKAKTATTSRVAYSRDLLLSNISDSYKINKTTNSSYTQVRNVSSNFFNGSGEEYFTMFYAPTTSNLNIYIELGEKIKGTFSIESEGIQLCSINKSSYTSTKQILTCKIGHSIGFPNEKIAFTLFWDATYESTYLNTSKTDIGYIIRDSNKKDIKLVKRGACSNFWDINARSGTCGYEPYCTNGYTENDEECTKTSYVCDTENGWNYSGSQCRKTNYSCNTGWSDNGFECERINEYCPTGYTPVSGSTTQCEANYKYYDYSCPTDINSQGQAWNIVNEGGDCNYECGEEGCFCNDVAPWNNCWRYQFTCPLDSSIPCYQEATDEINSIENFIEGYVYKTGSTIEHSETKTIGVICPSEYLNQCPKADGWSIDRENNKCYKPLDLIDKDVCDQYYPYKMDSTDTVCYKDINEDIELSSMSYVKDFTPEFDSSTNTCRTEPVMKCGEAGFEIDPLTGKCIKERTCNGIINPTSGKCEGVADKTCPSVGYSISYGTDTCNDDPICDSGTLSMVDGKYKCSITPTCSGQGWNYSAISGKCEKSIYSETPVCPDNFLTLDTNEKNCKGEALFNEWSEVDPWGTGNWTTSHSNTQINQDVNGGYPTFYLSTKEYTSSSLSGEIRIQNNSDNDSVGIVFGYKNSSNAFLVNWDKDTDSCTMKDQVLSLVHLNSSPGSHNNNGKSFIAGADKPWVPNTWQKIKVESSAETVKVYIDDTLYIDTPVSNLPDKGRVGFFNQSQEDVDYRDFYIEAAPVCSSSDLIYDVEHFVCYKGSISPIESINLATMKIEKDPVCPGGIDNFDENTKTCMTNVTCNGGGVYNPVNNKCEEVVTSECSNGATLLTNNEGIEVCINEDVCPLGSTEIVIDTGISLDTCEPATVDTCPNGTINSITNLCDKYLEDNKIPERTIYDKETNYLTIPWTENFTWSDKQLVSEETARVLVETFVPQVEYTEQISYPKTYSNIKIGKGSGWEDDAAIFLTDQGNDTYKLKIYFDSPSLYSTVEWSVTTGFKNFYKSSSYGLEYMVPGSNSHCFKLSAVGPYSETTTTNTQICIDPLTYKFSGSILSPKNPSDSIYTSNGRLRIEEGRSTPPDLQNSVWFEKGCNPGDIESSEGECLTDHIILECPDFEFDSAGSGSEWIKVGSQCKKEEYLCPDDSWTETISGDGAENCSREVLKCPDDINIVEENGKCKTILPYTCSDTTYKINEIDENCEKVELICSSPAIEDNGECITTEMVCPNQLDYYSYDADTCRKDYSVDLKCPVGENTCLDTCTEKIFACESTPELTCPTGYSPIIENGVTTCVNPGECPTNYERMEDGTCELPYRWYEYTCPEGFEGPFEEGYDCEGSCSEKGCQCNPASGLASNCRSKLDYNPNVVTTTSTEYKSIRPHYLKSIDNLNEEDFTYIRNYECSDQCQNFITEIHGTSDSICFNQENGEGKCFPIDGCTFSGEILTNQLHNVINSLRVTDLHTLKAFSNKTITKNSGESCPSGYDIISDTICSKEVEIDGQINSSCQLNGNIGWEGRESGISAIGNKNKSKDFITISTIGYSNLNKDTNNNYSEGFNIYTNAILLSDGYYYIADVRDSHGDPINYTLPKNIRLLPIDHYTFFDDPESYTCKINNVQYSICSKNMKFELPEENLKVEGIIDIDSLKGSEFQDNNFDLEIKINSSTYLYKYEGDGNLEGEIGELLSLDVDNENHTLELSTLDQIHFYDSYIDGYIGTLEFVRGASSLSSIDGFLPEELLPYNMAFNEFYAISGLAGDTYFFSDTLTDTECNNIKETMNLSNVSVVTDELRKAGYRIDGCNLTLLGEDKSFQSIEKLKKVTEYTSAIEHKCSNLTCNDKKECGTATCPSLYDGNLFNEEYLNTDLSIKEFYIKTLTDDYSNPCTDNECDINIPYSTVCGFETEECYGQGRVITLENNSVFDSCKEVICPEGSVINDQNKCEELRCPANTIEKSDGSCEAGVE